MTEYYPCRLCTLEVEGDDKSVQCDLRDKCIQERALSMVLGGLYNRNSLFYFKQQRFERFSLLSNQSTTFANLTNIEQRNFKNDVPF